MVQRFEISETDDFLTTLEAFTKHVQATKNEALFADPCASEPETEQLFLAGLAALDTAARMLTLALYAQRKATRRKT